MLTAPLQEIPARRHVAPWVLSGRIPCLDGFRAVAISAVIVSHLADNKYGTWALGHFGVTGFFVISGFLITLLLMREKQRKGDISIKSFYTRRALRILPAYIVFLAVIGVLQIAGYYSIPAKSWAAVLTYTSCLIAPLVVPIFAHTWSLSVEEQFYLIWPVLFRHGKARTLVALLCAVIAITPFFRWAGFHYNILLLDPNYSSAGQMASIAVGCLLAFIVNTRFIVRPAAVLWTGVAVLILDPLLRMTSAREWIFADSLKALGFSLVLLGVVHRPGSVLYRLLNLPLLSWIGVLSYSLYLWQQLFARAPIRPWIGLPALLLVSWLSYRYIESPFLLIKGRLAKNRGE